MRILAVGSLYPPHHLGGYELIWRGANATLRARDHEVRVLASDHRESGAGPELERDVHRELRWYWRDHRFPRLSPARRLALERHNGRVLERHVAGFRPDVVTFWPMGGMSLSLLERARRAGCPTAGVVCDDWLRYGPEVDAWTRMLGRRAPARTAAELLLRMPARFRPERVDGWLFISDWLRRRALQRWPLRNAGVAHAGIDRALFRAAAPGEWRWRLAYVGRIDPRKGIDAAVRALALLPEEATLAIHGPGDGRTREDLGALARSAGVAERVRFDRPPRSEVPAAYAAADVLAFPARWDEPWGLVPLEAMAVGTPVVATGTGGSGEYLRDGHNCLLVPRDDDGTAVAAAVTRLAGDPALRARLREAGLETAARFPEEALGAAVERLCRRIVGERPDGGYRGARP